MRIAICDDYMEHARDIQDKIAVINEEIETDLYDDIEQLFSEVRVDKRKYDAIFMDMEWENNYQKWCGLCPDVKRYGLSCKNSMRDSIYHEIHREAVLEQR